MEKGTYLIDTPKQKNVTLNLDFAKSVTNLPKTQKEVFHDGKKQDDIQHAAKYIQTVKIIEVTSSTTKREVIEVTRINTQKARLAQIELKVIQRTPEMGISYSSQKQ